MKYMGSKARLASKILPIVLADRDGLYVEPFVGGANTFHLVDGPKWGNDANADVVAMLQAVGNGWVPPSDISEDEYAKLRYDNADPKLRGFVGIGCSYSGKFFGGYARGNDSRGIPRNCARESRDNVLRQAKGLSGARWTALPYWEMDIPRGSTVYCDPPYANTTGYKSEFDSDKFWDWATVLSQTCNVFVSEFVAPRDWRCVWAKDRYTSLTKDTGSKGAVERLFVYGPS